MDFAKFPRTRRLNDGSRRKGAVSVDALSIREATQADLFFVVDSWFQSAHKGFLFRNMRSATYEADMPALIERLIRRSSVVVACEKSDDTEIIAWMCLERFVDGAACIHYSYTQPIFRRWGLQKLLLERLGGATGHLFYSHPNEASVAIAAAHKFECRPFLAFEAKGTQQ